MVTFLTSRFVASAALAVVWVFCRPVLADSASFRWDLDPDQELRVRWSQTVRTEIRGEKSVAWTVRAAIEMRWRVEAVDQDGTLHMSQHFTRLILRMSPAEGPDVDYDSKADQEPPLELRELAAAMPPLLDRRFSVAMSPLGRFHSVQDDPASHSTEDTQPANEPWTSFLTPDGWERAFRPSLGLLPDGPVQPGDQWHHQETVQTPQGPLRAEHTYRYEGTVEVDGGPLQVIRGLTEATAGPPPGAFDKPQPPDQRQTAIYHFNADAGYLVQSDLVQTIVSDVPDSDPPLRVTIQGRLRTRIEPWK